MTFDLRRAQDLVDSIPEVQESIPYLTQLANGSNPEIPGFLLWPKPPKPTRHHKARLKTS
jgi:hypothetical protein